MSRMNTNLDDWETDPDYVKDMDEMDQRWGSKRTVGSINMNDLINEVRRDHKTIQEKNHHQSQRDYSSGLERNTRLPESTGFEKISRKVVTEKSESSFVKDSIPNKEFGKQVPQHDPSANRKPNPTTAPKPDINHLRTKLASKPIIQEKRFDSSWATRDDIVTDPPKQFKESIITKRIFEEEKSTSSSRDNLAGTRNPSAAFKSIQDKIDAFKKEFESVENKVAKKSDISRVIKKSTNIEKFNDDVKYVRRSNDKLEQSDRDHPRATTTSPSRGVRPHLETRPSSTSPMFGNKGPSPKTSIRSLSEKFESLGRETSEDFRRRMEEKRREFFDEIKTQVRETRKGLDGFDIVDSDDESRTQKQTSKCQNAGRYQTVATGKPKVYTKRETTQEKVVSTFVKENDQIIHDETKRNVERTSSCHGSSDEEPEPSSIRHIHREFKTSSQPTSSPIDDLRRRVPYVEPVKQSSGLMARTLYDYEAAEDDELSFDVDELITNIEMPDKGWYKGTITRDGRKKVGLFPANYVKLLQS